MFNSYLTDNLEEVFHNFSEPWARLNRLEKVKLSYIFDPSVPNMDQRCFGMTTKLLSRLPIQSLSSIHLAWSLVCNDPEQAIDALRNLNLPWMHLDQALSRFGHGTTLRISIMPIMPAWVSSLHELRLLFSGFFLSKMPQSSAGRQLLVSV